MDAILKVIEAADGPVIALLAYILHAEFRAVRADIAALKAALVAFRAESEEDLEKIKTSIGGNAGAISILSTAYDVLQARLDALGLLRSRG